MIPPPSLSPEEIRQLSPASVAYLGDAVLEVFTRQATLWPPQRIQTSHAQVVKRVQAQTQAYLLTTLWDELTPAEQQIALWGRNGSGRGSRSIPAEVYRQASAWETLIGYLYLTHSPRLPILLQRSLGIPFPDFVTEVTLTPQQKC